MSNESMISGLIFMPHTQTSWLFTEVYGPSNLSLKPKFWDQLLEIDMNWNRPWIVIGDFNTLLEQKDKLGGRKVAQSSTCGFRKLIDQGGLIDMGFKGATYTWSNKRSGKVSIQERLDKGMINSAWRMMFPNPYVSHLTALHSDHRPLLLNTNLDTNPSWTPFRFETMWTRDPNDARVIAKAWT